MNFKKHLLFALSEGKIDDVNDKYTELPENEKQNVLKAIPHGNAQHYDWALKHHSQSPLDLNDLHNTLKTFNDNKDKLSKKNIHHYKSFSDLKQTVSQFKPKPKDHTVVYDSPTLRITQHHTHQSAIEGGTLKKENPHCQELNGKAKWCVSADSSTGKTRFDSYTKNGSAPLYTIDDKTNKRKYALVADKAQGIDAAEIRDEHNNYPHYKMENDDYERHISKNPDDHEIHHFIKKYPELMHTPLKSFLSGEDSKKYKEVRNRILSGEYTDKDVDTVFSDPQHDTARYAIARENPQDIKQHHIDKFMENDYKAESLTREELTNHPLMHSGHISTLMKSKDTNTILTTLKNDNIKPEHLMHALDIDHYKIQVTAIKHKNADQEVYKKAISSVNYIQSPVGVNEHISNHIPLDKMDNDTLNHYFKSRSTNTDNKVHILKTNPSLTTENVYNAYKHGFKPQIIAALQHPAASKEMLERAKTVGSAEIKQVAEAEYNKRYPNEKGS